MSWGVSVVAPRKLIKRKINEEKKLISESMHRFRRTSKCIAPHIGFSFWVRFASRINSTTNELYFTISYCFTHVHPSNVCEEDKLFKRTIVQ